MTRSERESIDHERRKLDGHGDRIKSRTASEEYRQNFDRIQWGGSCTASTKRPTSSRRASSKNA